MDKFIKILTGSHLYQLDNKSSDKDFKEIIVPSKEDCYLNRIGKIKQHVSKNEDIEIFSIQDFVKQLINGQTNALDMVHVDENNIEYCNNTLIWERIVNNRKKLYTKKMYAMCSYAAGQAQKYSFKIQKYQEVSDLIDKLQKELNLRSIHFPREPKDFNINSIKLSEIYDELDLSKYKYASKELEEQSRNQDNRCLQVCGRILQIYAPLTYCIDALKKIRTSFGSRVVDCANLGKADFKSLSHAFRLGYQLQMIYEQGDYYFPLPQTDFLRQVKNGKLDYEKDQLGEKLQNLIDKCENLASVSEYPEKVDREFWDNVILEFYK